MAREHAVRDGLTEHLAPELEQIMCRLFDVGAAVATPLDASAPTKVARSAFATAAASTAALEVWIDARSAALPPLKNFVLPSGGLTSSHLHVARAVCRRAERTCHALVEAGSLEPEVRW